MSKIVTIAARNARIGDTLIMKEGVGALERAYERKIVDVRRLDCEDRILVQITVRDFSTWTPSLRMVTLKLYHTIQVRKGDIPRATISWEPCYYDTTNRMKPLPKPSQT